MEIKYKLINCKTKEEHLCEKVTIDRVDYYVSDEIPKENDVAVIPGYVSLVIVGKIDDMVYSEPHRHWQGLFCDTCFEVEAVSKFRKVIATNNPNTLIPKIVDKVKKIGYTWFVTADKKDTIFDLGWLNIFKGGYDESQKTHPFSREDMIDFYEWCDTSEEAYKFWRKNQVFPDMDGSHNIIIKQKREKLFDLWLNTKPQTIYYGN